MKPDIFNTNFSHENYADYLSLIFEDKNFTAEELKDSVTTGINKGIRKYKDKKRKVNIFVYVTYFVKIEVEKYKKSKLLINLSFRKK